MMEVAGMGIDFFLSRLKRRNPISYARYGDGEFNAILGRSGQNCDGHVYFPEMGVELARTLTQPRKGNYLYGIGPKASRSLELREEVERWLRTYAGAVAWNTSEVFLNASLEGGLGAFIAELRRRKVVWFAPPHMTAFLAVPGWTHYRTTPVNAWLNKQEMNDAAMWLTRQHQPEVVAFCAGMVSKALIWELFPSLGAKVHLWDMGSVFDMYCGVDSRSYARRMSPERKAQLKLANFGSEESLNV